MATSQVIELKIKKFEKIFKYLSLKQPSEIIEDRTDYKYVTSLKNLLLNKTLVEANKNWKSLTSYNMANVFVKFIDYYAQILDELNLKEYNHLNINYESLNNRRILILNCLIQILYNLSEIQFENEDLTQFLIELVNKNIFDSFIPFFSNKNFISQYNKDIDFHYLIISIVKSVRNITEIFYLFETNPSTGLIKTLSAFNDNCKHGGYGKEFNEIVFNFKQKSLNECVKYLCNINSTAKLINDIQAYYNFFFIYKLIQKPSFKSFETFTRNNFESLLIDLTSYMSKTKLVFNNIQISTEYSSKNPSENEIASSIFYYLLIINNFIFLHTVQTRNLSLSNMSFSKLSFNKSPNQIAQAKQIMKVYLDMISNEEFISKLRSCQKTTTYNIIYFIHKMSIYADDYKKDWKRFNVSNALINYADREFRINKNKLNEEILLCYWIVCFIADESISKYQKQYRTLFKYIFKKMESIENFGEPSLLNFSLKSTLNLLTRMAVNQSLQLEIFENFSLIKPIIYNGNEIEQFETLKLLANLSFNQAISENLLYDDQLTVFIHDLFQTRTNENKIIDPLRNLTEIILYNLNNSNRNKLNANNNEEPANNKSKIYKNVYISSYYISKGLVRPVKDELENNGYTVFYKSSNLTKTKQLIEMSGCLIMCISEEYKRNEFCQFEACYAFKLKKIIIPVIIQDGFSDDKLEGWLSFITNQKDSRNLVSMVNKDFDECMRMILNRIPENNNKELMNEVDEEENKTISIPLEKWNDNMVK